MEIAIKDQWLTNRFRWLRSWHPDAQRAVDWACALFPPSVQERGLSRGYYDYLWVLDELLRMLPEGVAGLRVLDVGCGAGVLDLALAHLGAQVTGLDRFEEYEDAHNNQMGTAQEIVARLEANGIEVARRDVATAGLPDHPGAYDVVLFLAVIEHLHESPKGVLGSMHGLLRPGGRVVITTPNHAWLRTRLRLLTGRSANHPLADWWEAPFFGHVREYTLPELRQMLVWTGFTVERATIGNWLHVASRIRGTNGEPDRWTTSLRLDSLEQVIVAASLCVTALVPSLRYTMLAIGRKQGTQAE